jgi:hypothetical protein
MNNPTVGTFQGNQFTYESNIPKALESEVLKIVHNYVASMSMSSVPDDSMALCAQSLLIKQLNFTLGVFK